MTGPAAPHEQRIAQPVQVADCLGRRFLDARQGHGQALRAAADGPRDVQLGIQLGSSRQHETAQCGEFLIHRVDLSFQLFDFRWRNPGLLGMKILRQRRKLGTKIEELMLHPAKDFRQPAELPYSRGFVGTGHASQADEGIQLVHRTVGFDARGVLGDPLSSCQGGLALVATLGVDAIEGNSWIVKRWFRHTSMLTWGLLNPVSPLSWIILLAAATLAGIANALAGGGTFMIFPALVFAGVDPIMANATSSVITLPGGIASALVYRRPVTGKLFWILVLISVAGGVAGSQLLLHTSSGLFSKIVPFLMIGASLVFSFSNQLRAFASKHSSHMASGRNHTGLLYAGTLAIAIYGGYFGAGMGVLMIVLFLITANIGVQESAGLRMWCATGVNTLAVAAFIAKGIVVWRVAIPMLVCTLIGGYWGAHAVQRLTAETARRAVLVFAWTMSLWLLVRSWK